MQNEFVSYTVGSPYSGPDEDSPPSSDAVGLMFEGVPVYKVWIAPPVTTVVSIVNTSCQYIGFTRRSKGIGSMPFFVFGDNGGKQIRIQAPMCSSPAQFERWAKGDSNAIIFVLIDGHSQLIQSITTLSIPSEFRARLIGLWASGSHMQDLMDDGKLKAAIIDQTFTCLSLKDEVWIYDENSRAFINPSDYTGEQPQKGGELIEIKRLAFANGERIQFTRSVDWLGVSAATLGTITELNEQGDATVLLDSGKSVSFNLKRVPSIDYGYAIGTYAENVQSIERLLLDEDQQSDTRLLVGHILKSVGYVPLSKP